MVGPVSRRHLRRRSPGDTEGQCRCPATEVAGYVDEARLRGLKKDLPDAPLKSAA
jgi:hypothetical protein